MTFSGISRHIFFAALVMLGLIPAQAFAQTTFEVRATVNANCVGETATDIDHGVYDPLAAADDDATGTISVRCSNGTPYTVELDEGTGGGDFTTRTLGGSNTGTLDYNLYRNATRTEVWGDETGGSYSVSGTGAGLGVPQAQSHTVYSRIPAGQTAAIPGLYSSTIQVTISY